MRERISTTRVFFFVAVTCLAVDVGGVTIKVPNIVVAPGATEVTAIATISGGLENIAGMEFFLLVANGGPGNPSNPPGQPVIPIAISRMTSLFAGSVFADANANELYPFPRDTLSQIFPGEYQVARVQTIVEHDQPFASINGVDLPLVNFTLKLHAPSSGTYPLIASGWEYASTLINDDSRDDAVVPDLVVIDGSITIPAALIPEPGTGFLAGLAGVILTCCVWNGRRRVRTSKGNQ